jgi:hypothetical protein
MSHSALGRVHVDDHLPESEDRRPLRLCNDDQQSKSYCVEP